MMLGSFYRCAVCFLGVFLITKSKKKAKAFEPYVTMDMVKGWCIIQEHPVLKKNNNNNLRHNVFNAFRVTLKEVT